MNTNTLNALGIKIPKAIAQAEVVRTAVLAATVYADGADTEAVTAMIRNRALKPADAVAELRKLGEATAVRTALRAHAVDIAAALDYADRAALVESADELYAALRPIVVEHGAGLAAAVLVVGTSPDATVIAKMGSAAGTAWGEFDRTLGILRQVQAIVVDIATASGAGRNLSPLVWQDLASITTVAKYHQAKALHRLQDIAAAGVSLTLNTPADIDAVIRRVDRESAAAQAAADQRVAAVKADFSKQTLDAMTGGKLLPPVPTALIDAKTRSGV